jgi:competence protein ComEC
VGKFSEKLVGLFERQHGTTVLWAPIGLTFGIWFYFSLVHEPSLWLTGCICLVAVATFWLTSARGFGVFIAIILSGFVLAKIRTELVGTPLLKAPTGEIAVVGIVGDIQGIAAKRGTVLLQPTEMEGVPKENMPQLLRLTIFTRNGVPPIGARIAFKGRLAPIPQPTMPGGFDYGRQLYFQAIGGTGRITSPITILGQNTTGSLWLSQQLYDLRQNIGNRIRQHLKGTIAAVADAIITGERAAIPKDTNKSLQISGLAHILSISGLHMSLAAGGVFWVVRALLAFFPHLAQNYPIKKWAAAAALVFGFVYMLLAGSQPATQRSYIMLAVIFLAVMVDRPAISLRNLALAALLILVTQPESAIQASFQMSFMAVMGLAAFFEFWNKPAGETDYRLESRVTLLRRKSFEIVTASILTTVVAGAFSSIPAAYHFGRLAPYGVLANGLAIPVMSFLVMPSALLTIVLMPFGLEGLPLAALGYGLELVLGISDYVAQLPGAQRVIPLLPIASAICLAVGGTSICLLRGKGRWLGGILLLAGLAYSQLSTPPDILIEGTAANMAYRNSAGELVFANVHKGRFAAEKWLQANGEETSFKAASARSGWQCEQRSCHTIVKDKRVAYFFEGIGTEPSCQGLDIVVANYPLKKACKTVPVRIDRFDVWRDGAYAISIREGATIVANARGLSGSRPWVVVREPRRKLPPALWRGASTHSPFTEAGSIRSDVQFKNQHIRTTQ